MGSDNSLNNLPEIDLSGLERGTLEWDYAKSKLWKAVEHYGCFRVVFRKIPKELPDAILSELRELFDLPLETKLLNNDISELAYGGYVGISPFGPLYESIGFDDPFKMEKIEKLISTLLPPGKPDFCKNVHNFSKQMSELEIIIITMIVESLGIEKYLDEHLNSVFYSFRVQKYGVPKTGQTEIGLNSHKDQDVMTILYQTQVDALEVETKDGQWVDAKLSPDNFVVVIGESLHAWTNGRAYSPNHRVTMKANTVRYTTGLFTAFKQGYLVKAPEELVDEEHPLLYKPFDHYEYLKLIQRDAMENYGTTLKPYVPLTAYYGVDV
ncbi:probable 2-oxoglutarate-dependent dioxygenase AOP1 [Ricinus communis]|uniref:probable 2-oxoglutarate-dependent dioxygenase AOP1 n=1 Tax=Ricinus communis TaxID=3988 RepID=UPI00201A9B5D|nr:probable 2-oxoglutarate-dependent dioxygenase AOP1 [Ricinus communis]